MYYVYCRKEETQNKQPTSISRPPQALTSGAKKRKKKPQTKKNRLC